MHKRDFKMLPSLIQLSWDMAWQTLASSKLEQNAIIQYQILTDYLEKGDGINQWIATSD